MERLPRDALSEGLLKVKVVSETRDVFHCQCGCKRFVLYRDRSVVPFMFYLQCNDCSTVIAAMPQVTRLPKTG